MSKITWDDSLSVLNVEIDEQHQKWIEIFNNMHEALLSEDQTAQNTIAAEALKKMQDYVQYHFDFEEAYMRKNNYPDLYKHQRLHKDFDNRIYAYNRDIKEGKLVLSTEIIKLIKNWLLDHIGIEDKKFALFIERENKK